VIVDAVGVCESDKATSKPLDRKPSSRSTSCSLTSEPAGRTRTVSRRSPPGWPGSGESEHGPGRADRRRRGRQVARSAGRRPARQHLPDQVEAQAVAMFQLPAGTEPTEKQLDAAEAARMQAALRRSWRRRSARRSRSVAGGQTISGRSSMKSPATSS